MALDLDFGSSNVSAHAPAIEELLAHQHGGKKVVARVGLGFKLDGQQVRTPLAWAYRVYVAWQKDAPDPIAASNAAFDSIPAAVGGVPTDVFFEARTLDSACQSELAPGMKMTPHRQGSTDEEGFGTIGLIVQQSGERFLLTDGHVLLKKPGGADPDVADVFVPERKSLLSTRDVAAISVPAKLRNLSLRVDPHKEIFVAIDIGLARIQPGMEFSATPIEAGGPVQAALRDLVAEAKPAAPSAPIMVWKYGARTELTRGVVVELLHVLQNRNVFWSARVQPTDGYDEPSRLFVAKTGVGAATIDELIARMRNRCTKVERAGETNASHVLSVTGPAFSWMGDSGAAVYDASGKLTGLIQGGEGFEIFDAGESEDGLLGMQVVMTEPSAVSYIVPAFSELGLKAIDIVTASGTTAGAAVAVPGAAIVPSRRRVAGRGRLGSALAASRGGRLLLALAERHRGEVVELVHHRRRVAVAYHRGKAAGFARALLAALDGTRANVPAQIDGIAAGAALRTLFAALTREASAALREDLARYGDWIADLTNGATSVQQLLDRLADASC